MFRTISSLAIAILISGCNTTDNGDQVASAEAPSPLSALEPASGDAAATVEPVVEAAEAEAPAAAPVAEIDTSEVDQKAQAYLTCVVSNAAQSAEAGTAHEDAVEVGVDACRNEFRSARWAYLETGVAQSAADRYGVNLLDFVRGEASNFLSSQTQ